MAKIVASVAWLYWLFVKDGASLALSLMDQSWADAMFILMVSAFVIVGGAHAVDRVLYEIFRPYKTRYVGDRVITRISKY